MSKKILVAGGAGFIGSHILVELLEAGYEAVCVDNLYNSSEEAVRRVRRITKKDLTFYRADFLDECAISEIFGKERPDAVIMCAGYKAVGESVEKPLEYYFNNLSSLMLLLDVMRKSGTKKIIFSSSATVYGCPAKVPISEDFPCGAVANPYGRTKYFVEEILKDAAAADPSLGVTLLRYFNPIGAHPSGLIGEDPSGIPNNLVPYIADVAIGKRDFVTVFGDDFDTPDGTGVRDYIHVVDLSRGHVCALRKLLSESGVHIYNLGTGRGYSVLEVIDAYEKASGCSIPYIIGKRRPGDIGISLADPSLANRELGWKTLYDICDMCRDSYRFRTLNPEGYGERPHVPMCLED